MTVRDIINMIVVLTVVSLVCGGGLAMVKMATAEQVEYQKIKNVKEPALKKILSDYDNDPVSDRKTIITGKDSKGKDIKTTIFYAKKGGKLIAVAFEAYGSGYGGPIGVVMSINQPDEVLGAIAATTNSETPSVGGIVMASSELRDQYAGKPVDANFGLNSAGGIINAISGATMSSIGVSTAVKNGMEIYKKYKSDILG
ncbi:MAG: FMN-binding protein [Proteobacteria bacterium]|nr:FMN-binding protein [Desulfobacteraceae bacterium]MBU2522004.1 FMN-binding protein [Pseudomonadota bacterium]MBU3980519.1 FMN-binding protein [Pseudomonadota bacterium]MBU4013593.1 FMN-binding protein [Pseudomonadota bacterium]MBU4067367.1 FMN-binding protein [Pseudomonadota bacterium]